MKNKRIVLKKKRYLYKRRYITGNKNIKIFLLNINRFYYLLVNLSHKAVFRNYNSRHVSELTNVI